MNAFLDVYVSVALLIMLLIGVTLLNRLLDHITSLGLRPAVAVRNRIKLACPQARRRN